jgi:hypothetical protein
MKSLIPRLPASLRIPNYTVPVIYLPRRNEPIPRPQLVVRPTLTDWLGSPETLL